MTGNGMKLLEMAGNCDNTDNVNCNYNDNDNGNDDDNDDDDEESHCMAL